MPKQPVVTGAEFAKALRRAGWVEDRQSGSHLILDSPEGLRSVAVPIHSGRELAPVLLSKLLKQSGLTGDDLRRLLG